MTTSRGLGYLRMTEARALANTADNLCMLKRSGSKGEGPCITTNKSGCLSEVPPVPKAAWIHQWHRSDGVAWKRSSQAAGIWVPTHLERPAELHQLIS